MVVLFKSGSVRINRKAVKPVKLPTDAELCAYFVKQVSQNLAKSGAMESVDPTTYLAACRILRGQPRR